MTEEDPVRERYENMRACYGDEALDMAGYPGPEARIVTCPTCNGDGGWESSPTGYNHINGMAITHWITCRSCEGKGEAEIEAAPRTLEDIEQEDAEEHPREELSNCVWRGAATPFAENH